MKSDVFESFSAYAVIPFSISFFRNSYYLKRVIFKKAYKAYFVYVFSAHSDRECIQILCNLPLPAAFVVCYLINKLVFVIDVKSKVICFPFRDSPV